MYVDGKKETLAESGRHQELIQGLITSFQTKKRSTRGETIVYHQGAVVSSLHDFKTLNAHRDHDGRIVPGDETLPKPATYVVRSSDHKVVWTYVKSADTTSRVDPLTLIKILKEQHINEPVRP
jgi:hypothetical protein